MQLHYLQRRGFLKALAKSTILIGTSCNLIDAAEKEGSGPEKKSLGVVGLGKQGTFLAKRFPELVNVKAVCDVHQGRSGPAVQQIPNAGVRVFRDYRELHAFSELEGVAVATPDHWHALMPIEALAAGKHVYLEPPVCRSLAECRAMLLAERSPGKVVQEAVKRMARFVGGLK